MHASSRHPSFTALRLGAVAALLITGALFASQAMAEQAGSQFRQLQSGRLDAGDAHNCAIYDGGSVRCWGLGTNGRLGYGNVNSIGDGEAVNTAGPVDLGAGRTAVALAAGSAHTCALLDDGNVRCWGSGANGRLGYGNINDIGDNETPGSVGPVNLGAGRTAVEITAGGSHTCAMLDNSTLKCWGAGANGRLGYGNINDIGDNETPASVGAVSLGAFREAFDVAAGDAHTCATLDNGDVRCWGEGDFGRLGYGNILDIGDDETPGSVGPVGIGTGRDGEAITAGGQHTCVLLDDGNVRCWGEAANGRLGYADATDIGDTEAPSAAGPVNMGIGRTARAIAAGGAHTCAVLDNDTVRCWGEGDFGRLGYANQTDIGDTETPGSVGPVDVGSGRTGRVITTGLAHTCALLDDGTVRCWGDAASGRVGYGNTTDIGDTETPGSAGPVALGGTVDVAGPPPVANNDFATVSEDAPATSINVLANDGTSEGWTNTIQSATDPANGTVVITGGGTGLTYQPDPNYCNNVFSPDTFVYTLNGGDTATVFMTVTCVEDNPTAVNDSATVTEEAAATSIDVLANDTDPDGGTKLIQSASDPANGAVAITGGGTGLTYQPDPNYCNNPPGTNPDTFTYTLNGGSTATVSVTVNCVDDNPVAVNDSATVSEDAGSTPIDVLANDTDIDGGPKTITSVSSASNGTVGLTGGGAGVTYQPDPNYCNNPPGTTPDTFTYTLNGGSQATVSVTVNCVDDPPTAVGDSATVAKDDPPTAINVLSNDTDTDGGPMTIQSVVQPANGTVVITGGGSGLTYEPDPAYCNDSSPTDDFTYTLNGGSTATVAMTVGCIDIPPTAVDDSATVALDDGPTAVDVLTNDTDPDGGLKQIQSVTQPANGTVVITGGGSGLTYEPDPAYCNGGSPTDDFTYTLNGGSTATVAMTVTCFDDPPSAIDDSATVTEDDPATSVDVLTNDTDPDGGPKTISSATDPPNGTVELTGGSPGAHTGLTYEPDPDYCNDPPGTTPDTFTYTLNGGSEATVSVTVSCVEDDPVAFDDSASVNEDASATAIDVLANDPDPDGGTKLIQSASDPANGAVAITGGGAGLTYEPDPGYCNESGPTDDFTYTLNGGSEATVSVTVNCVDDDPVAEDDPETVAEDSGVTAFDVLANDTDPDGGTKLIQSASDPTNGTVAITGGGSGLTYQPEPEYCNDGFATDDFTYTLNGGSQATVFVAVNCVEDDPTAVDDSATVNEDSGTTALNVLGNDTDPDAGPSMLIQSTTQPANGTVAITGGGTGLTYQPDTGYCNSSVGPTDDFTYTLNGGSEATVSVTVTCAANLVPPANPPGSTPPSVTTPDGQRLDVLRLVVPRSVSKLASKGIKLLATCRQDCRIVVKVSVTSSVMRQMGLRRPLIAAGSAAATAGQATWVTVRLTKQARAAIFRYGGGGRLKVDVQALSPYASTAVLHLD